MLPYRCCAFLKGTKMCNTICVIICVWMSCLRFWLILLQSYLATFTIKLAMKFIPMNIQGNNDIDPVQHIAVYAAEISLKSLVNDVRMLVRNAVLVEILPIIEECGLDAFATSSRKKALLQWYKSSHPLSLDPSIHPSSPHWSYYQTS